MPIRPRHIAWVRSVPVKGIRYVQAAREGPNKRLTILGSFGKENMESVMRARLYVAAFNDLMDAATGFHAELHNQNMFARSRESVFAVYGWILDRKAIELAIGKENVDPPPTKEDL